MPLSLTLHRSHLPSVNSRPPETCPAHHPKNSTTVSHLSRACKKIAPDRPLSTTASLRAINSQQRRASQRRHAQSTPHPGQSYLTWRPHSDTLRPPLREKIAAASCSSPDSSVSS